MVNFRFGGSEIEPGTWHHIARLVGAMAEYYRENPWICRIDAKISVQKSNIQLRCKNANLTEKGKSLRTRSHVPGADSRHFASVFLDRTTPALSWIVRLLIPLP
jgi:hypothetical protein